MCGTPSQATAVRPQPAGAEQTSPHDELTLHRFGLCLSDTSGGRGIA